MSSIVLPSFSMYARILISLESLHSSQLPLTQLPDQGTNKQLSKKDILRNNTVKPSFFIAVLDNNLSTNFLATMANF